MDRSIPVMMIQVGVILGALLDHVRSPWLTMDPMLNQPIYIANLMAG